MIAIGEASRLSGVAIETIRYYEREGIISKAGRTASGRRVYSETDISELQFIKGCRDLGFSIQEALVLRKLAKEPANACPSVEEIGRQHLAAVRVKISKFRRLETELASLVDKCSKGGTDCPMLTALMVHQS